MFTATGSKAPITTITTTTNCTDPKDSIHTRKQGLIEAASIVLKNMDDFLNADEEKGAEKKQVLSTKTLTYKDQLVFLTPPHPKYHRNALNTLRETIDVVSRKSKEKDITDQEIVNIQEAFYEVQKEVNAFAISKGTGIASNMSFIFANVVVLYTCLSVLEGHLSPSNLFNLSAVAAFFFLLANKLSSNAHSDTYLTSEQKNLRNLFYSLKDSEFFQLNINEKSNDSFKRRVLTASFAYYK